MTCPKKHCESAGRCFGAPTEKAKAEGGAGNHVWNMALLYGRLGETEKAIAWLEDAIRHRHGFVIYAKVHPWLDSLRHHLFPCLLK